MPPTILLAVVGRGGGCCVWLLLLVVANPKLAAMPFTSAVVVVPLGLEREQRDIEGDQYRRRSQILRRTVLTVRKVDGAGVVESPSDVVVVAVVGVVVVGVVVVV